MVGRGWRRTGDWDGVEVDAWGRHLEHLALYYFVGIWMIFRIMIEDSTRRNVWRLCSLGNATLACCEIRQSSRRFIVTMVIVVANLTIAGFGNGSSRIFDSPSPVYPLHHSTISPIPPTPRPSTRMSLHIISQPSHWETLHWQSLEVPYPTHLPILRRRSSGKRVSRLRLLYRHSTHPWSISFPPPYLYYPHLPSSTLLTNSIIHCRNPYPRR